MTRARVLKMAQTLGYRPNFAARHLKLNRKLQISVHLPREIASFFDALREGIEEAAAPFAIVHSESVSKLSALGEKDVELFEEALAEETQGIILAPGHPADSKPWIRRRREACSGGLRRHRCAGNRAALHDFERCGQRRGAGSGTAHAFCEKPGPVLIVTGDLNTVDHAEKVRGFTRMPRNATQSPLKVAAVHRSARRCRRGVPPDAGMASRGTRNLGGRLCGNGKLGTGSAGARGSGRLPQRR